MAQAGKYHRAVDLEKQAPERLTNKKQQAP